jgi:hypothetical protein
MGKVGVILLLLNEIRGALVVLSVLAAWSHAGKAAPPPAPAATAPIQASGRTGAIVRPGPPWRRGGGK